VNPELDWLGRLSLEEFREAFRGTPVKRAKHAGLLRNVAIAMGNSGEERFLPVLEGLARNEELSVREAAEWALRKLHG
jgi:epoxyqueuosine reductase